jgi:hypothetical protein
MLNLKRCKINCDNGPSQMRPSLSLPA